MYEHLPAILRACGANHKPLVFHAIHEFDHAVMPELQPVRQLSDGRGMPVRQTFDCEQKLMLLRLQSEPPDLLLAEMQETPDLIPELGQISILP